jgi:tetratricopeptide (TPR) repeat protein
MSKHCSFEDDPTVILMAGYELKQAAAAKLEQRLKHDPLDLPCRLKLLGYYSKTCFSSKSDARKQLGSILWMIEKMPEHKALGTPCPVTHKPFDPAGYDKCKRLWLAQLAKHKDNVAVITNAASFLRCDWRLAEKLYRQAIALEPKKAEWSRDLAWLLRLAASKDSPRMRRALAAIQDALRKTKEPARKRYLYDHLAEIAFDVGEWSMAQAAAKKSLSLVGKYGRDWYDGNAIHDGNCILGRLALRNGHLRRAVFYLDEAVKTCGSPQLNSFGPNMRFAQEMLRAGQREAVTRYLNACKRFWDGESESLSDCIAEIARGKSPRLPRVI